MPEFSDKDEQELFSVGPFEGIDNTSDPYYMEGGMGVDATNLVPDRDYNAFCTAQGRIRFGSHPLAALGGGAAIITGGLWKYMQNGLGFWTGGLTPYYFALVGSTMYYWTYSSATASTITPPPSSGFTGNTPQWVSYPDTNTGWGSGIFYNDGFNSAEINIGSQAYNWQIAPPTTAPVPALYSSSSTGPVNSAATPYYYRYTYVSGAWPNYIKESSPSPVSAAFVDTGGNWVSFTVTPSTDPQVTGIAMYRLGGTSGTWTEVIPNTASAPAGTNTSNMGGAFDTTTDANLQGQSLVLHRDPPAAFCAMEVHKDHIWGFASGYNVYNYQYNSLTNTYGTMSPNQSDIWFSNFAEPWGFDNTNQVLACGHNQDGDNGVALASLGSLLVAFKNYTTWAVYGDTQSDFLVRRLFDIGCMTKYSVVKAYGVVYWLSDRGVWMFDGGDAPTNLSRDIKAWLDARTIPDLQAAVAFLHYRKYCLSFPNQGVTWMLDMDTRKWWKLGWACNAAIFDPTNNQEVTASEVSGGVSNGYVDNWFAAETDLGNPITSSYTTRIADSGQSIATKQYRHIILQAPPVASGTATVQVIVNPGIAQKTSSYTFNLASPQPRKMTSIPPTNSGNEVQAIITLSTTIKTVIQKLSITGYIKRRLKQAG